MPGGRTGPAGERGAGKTALTRPYCDRLVSGGAAADVARVMVSAPVRQDTSCFSSRGSAAPC